MRVLIISLGSAGRRHLANLQALAPDSEITVWHQHTDQADVPSDGLCHVFAAEDAIAFQPDAAIVCSPAPLHVDNALPFAEAGVHLLMEKPLSDGFDGVQRLLDACEKHGAKLLVGYHLRFEQSLRAMRDAVVAGRIGVPLHLMADVGQYLPDWRAGTDYRQGVTARSDLGGGVLLELSHEIDYARWIMGDVAEVSAFTGRLGGLEIDVEDTADIMLRFASGAQGSLHMDMIRRAPIRRCTVAGADGVLTWDGLARRTTLQRSGTGETEVISDAVGADYNAYEAELSHFLECVRGDAAPAVTGADGLRVLELVDAAKQADRDGRSLRL